MRVLYRCLRAPLNTTLQPTSSASRFGNLQMTFAPLAVER
jgi:hypothetical protein